MCPSSWNLAALESSSYTADAVVTVLAHQKQATGSSDFIDLGRTPHPVLGQGRNPHSSSRIFGHNWTSEQLQVVEQVDREVQRHPQHMLARLALVNHARASDVQGIRSMVAGSMNGIAGTYYIVVALHLAQMAITFPHKLTATQFALLVAPLEAAELAGADVPVASPLAA
ncbi:hypothetical protein [Arthrobacter sp. Cr_A7]|uniref:hypothetical protein n=1 Tax=Arthrobacter sp. Cr_A7 TaxID=3031017 RepID=UPI0023DAA2FC|nr:hypothetical protein [Arthrobacter sp. Cr_A7]MDF2050598.1 hypothetical protein [Arthrobacter sp. Cr_A7]